MESKFLISGITTGKLNALVKNIMKQTGISDPEEAVRMINSGELLVSIVDQKWTEKNGVIYLTVASDGTTGDEWISRLESKNSRVGYYTKSILRSKHFKPTSGVIYKIAILKGELFNDAERITKNIRKEAKSRNLLAPNAEVACLIREKLSDKDLEAMGLYWIITMHEPIKDFGGTARLLGADRSGAGAWLGVGYGGAGNHWSHIDGFAFVVAQVQNI